MTPFRYRGFHDLPRLVLFDLPDGRRILLDSPFNQALDEPREDRPAD